MKHRSLVLALLFALFARAEERRLIPIDGPILPAAGAQDHSQLATNGSGYVAIWYDQREPAGPKTYAMHFDAAGKRTEVWGHSIPIAGPNAFIASDGSNYLVVASDGNKTSTLLLDERGRPQRDARVVAGVQGPVALASNGTSYLLIARDSYWRFKAYLLDLDGRIVHNHELGLSEVRTLAADAQGRYRFVTLELGRFSVVTVSEAGAVERFALDAISLSASEYIFDYVAGYSSDRIFLAFRTSLANLYVQAFDEVGRRAGAPWSGTTTAVFEHAIPQAGSFVLIMRVGRDRVAARFSGDGTLLEPFAAAYKVSGSSHFASNGESFLAMWEDKGRDNDVHAHESTRFELQGIATSADTLITKSLPGQHDVQIAAGGGHELAVYRDDGGSLRAALDGEPIAFASKQPVAGLAAVKGGGENFLVTWREGGDKSAKAFGARISFDGRLLDPQPFSLGAIRMSGAVTDQQDIAYLDSHFLVATGDDFELHTVLVSNEGEVSDHRTKSFNRQSAVRWPHILQSGSTPLIATLVNWTDTLYYGWWTAELVKLDDGYRRLGGFPVGAAATLGVASGDRITLAFKAAAATAEIAQTARDGIRTLAWRYFDRWQRGVTVEPRIVASDDGYVIAWSEHVQWQNDVAVRVVRLDAEGNRVGEMIELVAHNASNAKPSIVRTDGGIRIAYSRVDPESGGAVLAFVETLPSTAPR